MFRATFRVTMVRVSTSDGSTPLRAGFNSTSSKVSPSSRWSGSIVIPYGIRRPESALPARFRAFSTSLESRCGP